MPVEVRFAIYGNSVATLVVSRTYPETPMQLDEGVGIYTATLQLAQNNQSTTVDGIRHVRADGAIALVRRALNALAGKNEKGHNG